MLTEIRASVQKTCMCMCVFANIENQICWCLLCFGLRRGTLQMVVRIQGIQLQTVNLVLLSMNWVCNWVYLKFQQPSIVWHVAIQNTKDTDRFESQCLQIHTLACFCTNASRFLSACPTGHNKFLLWSLLTFFLFSASPELSNYNL
jgi:hypothetical protein